MSVSLSKSGSRRGLVIILIDTFLMWAGFSMVIPLISVHYVDSLGWAAAVVGLILAIRQLAQQGLAPLSGMLADRWGNKRLICLGFFLRALGFVSLAWAATFPILLLSVLLTAFGGGLFEAPHNAAVAALTTEANRSRFYSLVGVISGLGTTLGTQIGALLLAVNFTNVALGAALCFLTAFFLTLLFLPPIPGGTQKQGFSKGFMLALRDRPFMIFNLLIMGYWFLWVQFTISLPLIARTLSGTAVTISFIYAINSGMNIVLGYPLIRLAERWLRPFSILIGGLIIMACGLGGIALVNSVPLLLLCVVFIALGSLLVMPSQQILAASMAHPEWLGSYLGLNALSLGLGGALGNYSGGLLYDLAKSLHAPPLPWLVFLLVGLSSALGLWFLARSVNRRKLFAAHSTS